MARFVKREMPDLHNDGKPRAYYKMETYRNYGSDEFLDYVVSTGVGISASMVEAVLVQVTEKLSDLLGMGYTVNVKGLGTFSTKIGPKKGKEVEDLNANKGKLNASSVEVTGVNLKVDKRLVKKINKHCDLQRAGERRLQKSPHTEAERLEMAKQYLKKNGKMGLSDYVALVGLSQTTAHRELYKFADDPNSGITYTGRGPKRQFVLVGEEK
jgi:predicted histone-like DNA-binding protein